MATLKQLLDVGTKVLSNIADYSRQLFNTQQSWDALFRDENSPYGHAAASNKAILTNVTVATTLTLFAKYLLSLDRVWCFSNGRECGPALKSVHAGKSLRKGPMTSANSYKKLIIY